MSTPAVRVVVADDQPLMRRAIGELVESEADLELVGQASNGAEAVRIVRETGADILLCDLDMPVMSGVEAIAELSATGEVRSIALTTFSSMDLVLAALRAGASGYLVKDATPEEIVDAVRQVREDSMVLSPSVVKLLAAHVTTLPAAAAPQPAPDAPELSEREHQVLQLLAGGLSNREIGAELHLSEGAVKLHLGRACDRLGARDRVQLLVRAVELGLVTPSLLKPETAMDRYR
ncbi:response regulator [Oceanitalea stevensii]|uniref:Response regulator transcription factor n=1 Tax=Oceanitalea stevensii TaxID=2763072 RepID=A0ABR8Z5G7_9MICO|nr:response regulator transcription factor [Oceanitalea stevensii]MBD8063582.1 response regulator transcription factor [Oceanitalea stevensii]